MTFGNIILKTLGVKQTEEVRTQKGFTSILQQYIVKYVNAPHVRGNKEAEPVIAALRNVLKLHMIVADLRDASIITTPYTKSVYAILFIDENNVYAFSPVHSLWEKFKHITPGIPHGNYDYIHTMFMKDNQSNLIKIGKAMEQASDLPASLKLLLGHPDDSDHHWINRIKNSGKW
jgi:hypothetical protein